MEPIVAAVRHSSDYEPHACIKGELFEMRAASARQDIHGMSNSLRPRARRDSKQPLQHSSFRFLEAKARYKPPSCRSVGLPWP